jgi:hypothetical protein
VQIEGVDETVEIGRERVVVVADTGLAGPAETAAVIGDDVKPCLDIGGVLPSDGDIGHGASLLSEPT